MLVTVIVPTYNRPGLLAEALESILRQTCQDLEIIVINDAGVDVHDVIAGLSGGGDIIYIEQSRNKGLAAARNAGIQAARGKYIAYLDDDDIFYPNHIETLVAFLEGSKYSVAYTDAYRACQLRKGEDYRTVSRELPYSIDFSKVQLLVRNIAPVLCFMHEKECLERIGLFDEQLTSHEDWDLWIRMALRYEFKHLKRVTAEFRDRKDGSSMTSLGLPDFLRTMKIIYKRHYHYAKGVPGLLEAQDRSLRELKGRVAAEERSFHNTQSG